MDVRQGSRTAGGRTERDRAANRGRPASAAEAAREPSRVGALLREWRRRRRLSQLDLALLAESSARHLSCVETGRAAPSREMVLRLAGALDVPLRERNALLVAAGYAPAYRESGLTDPGMEPIRSALETMLAAHEPYPAVAVDRLWNVVALNRAMAVFTGGVPGYLTDPEPNVYRLVLHPDGLVSRLADPAGTRELLLNRLRTQAEATGDPDLRALHAEVSAYPLPAGADEEPAAPEPPSGPISLPLRVRTPLGELSMFSTLATFGAPADVTLSELAIELFYPLDDFTEKALRALAGSEGSGRAAR
ncbi:helix-turn-helix transcriptional regulator [Nocardiopsis potens]|uniref:helix-turn-helix transcriptional regulator n=1 Tax=Nocardiopsis potens TaxID=1246458 RepID=UPI000347153B|nr:helix-turn-helix transcriptional regulator [Nocardiopsis potens]